MAEALHASETLVADESMLAWMGKHMPGWIIVPQKPKPQGLEWKTLCDIKTKLLLNIDIQEGKLRNATKEFNDMHKRSTGCTLRLLKPWFGSGRTLIADSWCCGGIHHPAGSFIGSQSETWRHTWENRIHKE